MAHPLHLSPAPAIPWKELLTEVKSILDTKAFVDFCFAGFVGFPDYFFCLFICCFLNKS